MNIFICGIPRAGKSTIARKLQKVVENSSVISTEAIRNGFQKINPEGAWGKRDSELRKIVFPQFVQEFVGWNAFFSDKVQIVDCGVIELDRAYQISSKKDIVICLGFGGKETKDIIAAVRQYESEKDYTKQFSDQQLLEFWGDFGERDKENIRICKDKGIEYFDMSGDREKCFVRVEKYIQGIINQ